MLIHSIVSLSDIFYNMDTLRVPQYRKVPGGIVETDGKSVTRLISTDPKLFLDARYEPGKKLQ